MGEGGVVGHTRLYVARIIMVHNLPVIILVLGKWSGNFNNVTSLQVDFLSGESI